MTSKSSRLAGLLGLTLVAASCSGNSEQTGSVEGGRQEVGEGQSLIAASVYPLSYVVREMAGEQMQVEELSKPGFEPHDAELTAGQIRTISRADLVVYLGGQFQPVVERAVAGLGDRALDTLPAAHLEERDVHAGHAEESAHLHEDPHVWLDPHRMQLMNRHIAERLADLRPAAARSLLSRAAETDAELRELDFSFSKGLKNCPRRDFMTGHGAFGYLAERYGLKQLAVGAGFSESEPSPGRMARLAVKARALGIQTVFYERSTSPASALTLAREIGAETAVLDSIETAPPSGDYLSAMRRNLLALRKALGCR